MVTKLGKELRKLRIDHNERLGDMGQKLGKSASFISAIEVGKKSPPVGFEDVITRIYNLSKDAANALRWAADQSRQAFVLHPDSALGRDTAGLLARRMDSLSEEQLNEIKQILLKKEEK